MKLHLQTFLKSCILRISFTVTFFRVLLDYHTIKSLSRFFHFLLFLLFKIDLAIVEKYLGWPLEHRKHITGENRGADGVRRHVVAFCNLRFATTDDFARLKNSPRTFKSARFVFKRAASKSNLNIYRQRQAALELQFCCNITFKATRKKV